MFQRTAAMYILLLILVPIVYSRSLASLADPKEDPCSFSSGDYKLSWSYDELSSDVVFHLSAQSNLANFWSGVYMGEDAPTDAIGVFVRAGQIGLVDAQVTEDGIESDNLTNVQSLNFDLQEGGHLTAEFARPLTSQDPSDADLEGCTTFYFPVVSPQIDMGGPVDLPANIPSKRVCNIQEQCLSAQEPSDLVKRADKPVCAYSNQKSSLSWRVSGDNLIFSVQQPAKKGKWWTAIGVGESMQDLSMIIAFTENGKLKKTGSYKTLGYAPPAEETSAAPGLTELNSAVKNNKAVFELSVGMDFLKKYTENGCTTLQVAILAGHYGKDFAVLKHEDTPLAIPICGIEQCTSEGATEAESTASETEKEKETPKKNNKNNKHPNKHAEEPVVEPSLDPTTPAVAPEGVPEQPVDNNTNQMITDSPAPETGKGKGNKNNNKNNKHHNKNGGDAGNEAATTPPAVPEGVPEQPVDNNTNQMNPESNIELVAENPEHTAVEGEGAQVRDEPLDTELIANVTKNSGLESGVFGPAAKAVLDMNLTSTTLAGNAPVTTSGNWPISGGTAQSAASSRSATQPTTVGIVPAVSAAVTPATTSHSEDRPVSLPAGVVGPASVGTVSAVPEANQSAATVGAAAQSSPVPIMAATQSSAAPGRVVAQSTGAANQPTVPAEGAAAQSTPIPMGAANQSVALISTQPVGGVAAQSTVSSLVANRPTAAQPQADALDERTQPTPPGAATESHLTSNATDGAAKQERPESKAVDVLNGTTTSDNSTIVESNNNATHVILLTTLASATTTASRSTVTAALNTTMHTALLTTTTAKVPATVTKTVPATTVPTVTAAHTTASTAKTKATVTHAVPTAITVPVTTVTTIKLPTTVAVETTKATAPANPETSKAPLNTTTSVATTTASIIAATAPKKPVTAPATSRPSTTGATSAPDAIKGNELRKDVPVDAPLEKNGLGSAEELLEQPDSRSNQTTVTRVTGATVSSTVPVLTTTTVVKHETTTVPMKTVDSRTGNETVDGIASKKPEESHPQPTTLPPMSSASSAAGNSSVAQPVAEGSKVPATCDQEDLMVCEGYFNDYISKVKEWSDHHNHSVESQMWKACKLLSEVRHVPTLCCKRFKQDCATELEKIPKN